MKSFIFALFISIMATVPCLGATIDDKNKLSEFIRIHRMVISRFEYGEPNEKNEKFHYYSSLSQVYGDCDDFMSAMYFELWKRGLNPEAIAYDFISSDDNKRYRHTIVCADGYCFDNNNPMPFPESQLTSKLKDGTFSLVARGELNYVAMYDLSIFETIVTLASHAA